MSELDDRDLAAAFEHLRAPRSTARYAERPTLEAAAGRTSFASVLASVVAVAVALAGAGTFLALRGSREGGVATTGGAANPPGRAGAAMAYDSTAGLTVMYGGSGAAGKPLADTWLWNGSTWNRAASAGPGPMVAAHMADDPPAGGVLLIGLPAVVEPQMVCATGSGGVTGVGTSTGASNSSSSTAVPPATAGGSPGNPGAPASPRASGSAPPMPPSVPPCVATKPVAVQTWLFNSQGWHRVSAGGTAPPAGAQVAYDARSGAVLAVQQSYYPCLAGAVPCEVPLSGKATLQPDQSFACTRTVCPITTCRVVGPNAGSLPSRPFACSGGAVATWVWAHDRWSASPATLHPGTGQQIVGTNLVAGGAANAKLLAETFCADPAAKCQPPVTTQYEWDGSAWQVSPNGGGPFGPGDPTAIAAAGSKLVAIGTDGVWTTSHGGWWSQTTAAAPAARAGAALAPGPDDSVILFGGFAAPAVGVATSSIDASRVGSDTWTFNPASGWRHAGGSPPASGQVPSPSTPCASRKASPGCVEILPGAVSPRPTLVP